MKQTTERFGVQHYNYYCAELFSNLNLSYQSCIIVNIHVPWLTCKHDWQLANMTGNQVFFTLTIERDFLNKCSEGKMVIRSN